MAQDIGWSRFNEFDAAFAKAVGIALTAPDERTGRGAHDVEDDEDVPLFMSALHPQSHGL